MQEIELLYKELKQAQKLFKSNDKVIDSYIDRLIIMLKQYQSK